MNFDLNFSSYIKTNSKWIIDINMKHQIIEVLEENIGNILMLKWLRVLWRAHRHYNRSITHKGKQLKTRFYQN